MTRRALYAFGLLFAVLTLVVGACSPAPQVVERERTVTFEKVVTPTPEPFKPQGTLSVGLSASVNTLDPFNFPELNTYNVVHHICETLLLSDSEGTPIPGLAASWENLDDTTWRLKLQEGVKFHNGEPFDAEAVVFSWKYSQEPDVLQKWGFASVDDIQIEDTHTIKITTKTPDPLFLVRLADMGFIVPPSYIKEKGREYFAEHPVGTGPFKLAEWIKGDRVVLEANPSYWMPEEPKIAKVVFLPIPEVSSRIAALKAGQIDLAYRIESQFVPDLLFDPGVNVLRFIVPRVYYFGFNTMRGKDTPIDNEKVRQALAYAIDAQAIIDRVMEGNAVRVNGMVGNRDFGHDDSIPAIPYDVDKAKALLAEAGYPNGFEIEMGGPAGAYARGTEICEAAVGFWSQIGVKAQLQMIESGKYWDDAAQRKYPLIFFDSWSTRTGDAQERLEGTLLEEGSFANFYDKELGDLIVQIGSTVAQEQRKKMLSELQEQLQQKAPFIALFEPYGYQATSDRVVGYVPRGAETIYLWGVSLRQ